MPFDRGDGKPSLRCFFPVPDVLRVVRDYLDACLAVGEAHEGDSASLMDDGLAALVVREAMRDGDVTVAPGVDTRHVLAEEPTVRRGVAELVDSDVIVNHLMEDGILNEFFRQVNADVDAENEVLVAVAHKKALLAASEGHLAEKTLGMREFDGDRRQGIGKETGIVLVEARLYV